MLVLQEKGGGSRLIKHFGNELKHIYVLYNVNGPFESIVHDVFCCLFPRICSFPGGYFFGWCGKFVGIGKTKTVVHKLFSECNPSERSSLVHDFVLFRMFVAWSCFKFFPENP